MAGMARDRETSWRDSKAPTAAHHGGPQVCPNTVPVRDSHSAMPPQPSPHLATDQQTRYFSLNRKAATRHLT